MSSLPSLTPEKPCLPLCWPSGAVVSQSPLLLTFTCSLLRGQHPICRKQIWIPKENAGCDYVKRKLCHPCRALCKAERVIGKHWLMFGLNILQGQSHLHLKTLVGRYHYAQASFVAQLLKKPGDPSSIPGLGRSPGEGKGYPLQYSGLENSMDCIVHGVTKSWTWLSDFNFTIMCSLKSKLDLWC